MRQLATIRTIQALTPIVGADAILLATIDDWKVVVKLNEFKVGDLCVYFEIDSFLPDGNILWQHIVDKSSRVFEGAKGHRLKTIKLRGQISQGFACPVTDQHIGMLVGQDVTDLFGVKKWEASIPTELSGQVKGNFPSFIRKTEQERCQNIGHDIFTTNKESFYEITMKLDGTSFTAYYHNDEDGVCSRNWELKLDDPKNEHNSLVRMYVDSGLQHVLQVFRHNYAVQGELMGPSIQGNREELKSAKLFIFDIYDMTKCEYVSPIERHRLLKEFYILGLRKDMVEHVPILATYADMKSIKAESVPDLLSHAEGPSITHPVREGLVFKSMDGKFSFKVISNRYLLKDNN